MAAKQAARRGKQRGTTRVDFTGVETSGGRLLPEDTYQFELTEIEEEVGQDSGEPYWASIMEVADDGEFKGVKAYENFSLQPQSLWKLRSFLESAGYPTEDGPMDIDRNDLIGLIGTADVIHETYKNRPKHRINSWIIETDGKEKEDKSTARGANGGTKKVRRAEPDPEETVEWTVKDEASFKDGKKTLTGKIKSIDGDDVTVTVKGDGDYEMKTDDLLPAAD